LNPAIAAREWRDVKGYDSAADALALSECLFWPARLWGLLPAARASFPFPQQYWTGSAWTILLSESPHDAKSLHQDGATRHHRSDAKTSDALLCSTWGSQDPTSGAL